MSSLLDALTPTDDFPFLSLPDSLQVGISVSETKVNTKASYTLADGDVPSLLLQPNVGTKYGYARRRN